MVLILVYVYRYLFSDCPFVELILRDEAFASKKHFAGVYYDRRLPENGRRTYQMGNKAIWWIPEAQGDIMDFNKKSISEQTNV